MPAIRRPVTRDNLVMNTSGLSLDQAPPISIPFKFFLTASLFAIGVGVLFMLQGDTLLLTRWSPAALGVTHLITVGFLAQVMTGAMIQLLPVLAGSPLPAAIHVSRIVHLALLAGAVLLAAGFLFTRNLLLVTGAVVVAAAFALFLTAVAVALSKQGVLRQKIAALGIGWIALVPTLILGEVLMLGITGLQQIDDMQQMVSLHLSWGLLGWVGIVLFATVFQLVPIFYVTREFPRLLKSWALPSVFVLLLILTLFGALNSSQLFVGRTLIVLIFLLLGFSVFAVIRRRKRGIVDTTLLFIWTGMTCLALSAAVWIAGGNEILLGMLLLGGVCLTVPIGLIYKVVPFLCWFHLQGMLIRQERFSHRLPSMKHFIPEKSAKRHYFTHLAALVLLLSANWFSGPFTSLAGGVYTLSSIYLCKNILHAMLAFRKEQRALSS